jgi:gliding motility-associated-like protein
MPRIIILSWFLGFNILAFSQQQQLTVGNSETLTFGNSEKLSISGLQLIPDEFYELIGTTVSTNSATTPFLRNSSAKAYEFEPGLNGYSGTIALNYQENEVENLNQDILAVYVLNDDFLWETGKLGSVDTSAKVVSDALTGADLNAVVLSQRKVIAIDNSRESEIYGLGRINGTSTEINTPVLVSFIGAGGDMIDLQTNTDQVGNWELALEDNVNVGNYLLRAQVQTNAYNLNDEAMLALTPLDVLVSPEEISKTYGDDDPKFPYSLFSSSTIALSANGNLSRISGENVGMYPITLGSLNNPNYQLLLEDEFLEITKKPLKIIADDITKVFDEAPANGFSVSYDGFVFSDGPEVLDGGAIFNDEATSAYLPGTYSIVVSGFDSDNYEIEYIPGLLTIEVGEDLDVDGVPDSIDSDIGNDGFDDSFSDVSGLLTPGTLGIESKWIIPNIMNYPGARVAVYNRNGNEVFSAVDYKNDWNGTYRQTGKLLPSGVYYYRIILSQSKKVKQGWLYIKY